MTHPADTSDTTFETDVIGSDLPVLVDFWAPWCGPCRMMAPAFEQAAERLGPQALLVKVNSDDNPELSQRFGIRVYNASGKNCRAWMEIELG